MTLSRQQGRWLLAGLLLLVVGAGAFFYWRHSQALPGRATPAYRAYQRNFQIGVAALDAGRDELAEKHLRLAVATIPGEPAAWANLGLLNMRLNALDEAAKDLGRAAALAPDNGDVEALLGLLAEKQGRFSQAAMYLKRAVAKQPRDLTSLYALAEVVSKEGKPDHEAEYQRLLDQILKVQPNNLPILVKRAAAAVPGDMQVVRDTLDRLARLAPDWQPDAQKALADARKSAAGAPQKLIFELKVLNNVLKAERGYVRDSLSVQPRPGVIGTPVARFLKLEPARPTPAPADMDLAFTVQPWPIKELGGWHTARAVWMLDDKQRAALIKKATDGGPDLQPAAAFHPAIFVANAAEVRRADGAGPPLPFPSGPKQVPPTSAGLLAIDWDNDFRMDLLLAGAGGLRFWQQQADGSFADVTAKVGLADDVLAGAYHGAWAADVDMDGDLDIIAARRAGPPLLLRNNRDGTFKAMDIFAAIKDVRLFEWADLDNDGAPDAILLDGAGKLHVFANDRAGQFSAWKLPDDLGNFAAVTVADVDNDGHFDVVGLRSDGALMRITNKNNDRQTWDVAELARLAAPKDAVPGSMSIFAVDLDNNGAIDLVVAEPKKAHIFLADEKGKLAELPHALSLGVLGVLDVDRTGRLDLVGLAADGGGLVRGHNQGRKAYHWQSIWPLANPKAGDDRINSFAIGGQVEVRAGVLVQKQRIDGPVAHFGLGEESAADVVRMVWPNGAAQWEFDVAADKLIIAAQRLTGSCPFLFTHDGCEMQFVGDFMWGTPLGMFVNGQNIGDFPQTTEWLKIRGDQLVPRNGSYDVRVHANLWETDFFDQLALIAVDHRADTEIHVDERFFLTPTAPRVYLTTPARPVAAAWDHDGNDVTELVRAIDGRYLDHCGRGRFQGVTRDHWVEVDLGDDAPSAGPVLLIARGWLHPTNSSINVALTQGQHDMPRALSLEVPDGKGGWTVAQAALGFPAGKNKTMLIRLDGVAGQGVCRRFRLRTNMEIYWDFLGHALEKDCMVGLKDKHNNLAATGLRPTTADLRYRGILAMTQKDASSPELPHYAKVNTAEQCWRDLSGYYTRYGDVRELLAAVDDRYVIINAGDEIAMQFPVPPGPPTGWKRDFIWECDGWTRDGDLNTRHGTSVLPLPAHEVKTDERLPARLQDDPVYRRFPGDWQNYHTRYVTADVFMKGLLQK